MGAGIVFISVWHMHAEHTDKKRAKEVLKEAQVHFKELRQAEIKRGEGEIETSTQYYLGILQEALKG